MTIQKLLNNMVPETTTASIALTQTPTLNLSLVNSMMIPKSRNLRLAKPIMLREMTLIASSEKE